MTREEARQYAREYREEGFGKAVDARYYRRHKEEMKRKQRERDRLKRGY